MEERARLAPELFAALDYSADAAAAGAVAHLAECRAVFGHADPLVATLTREPGAMTVETGEGAITALERGSELQAETGLSHPGTGSRMRHWPASPTTRAVRRICFPHVGVCPTALMLLQSMHRKHDRLSLMAVLTVRNLPDEVHRALRMRAALRGRSTEAEVHAILKETVLPEGWAGLGSLLTAVGRRAGLTEEESAGFAQRDTAPGRPVDLE